jgi:hypothetical protein
MSAYANQVKSYIERYQAEVGGGGRAIASPNQRKLWYARSPVLKLLRP